MSEESNDYQPVEPAEASRAPSLSAKLLLGGLVLVVLVAAFLQLRWSGILGGKEEGEAEAEKQKEQAAPEKLVGEGLPQLAVDGSASLSTREQAYEVSQRLGANAAELVGIVGQLRDELIRVEKELEGTRVLYASAARQVGLLEKEAATAQLRGREVEALKAQLAESRALLALAERRSAALMAKLAASPDPATLREAQAMRDAFEKELRDTKMKLAQDERDKARLEADLVAANSELAASEQALESTTLFIESIELLPDSAKQLFLELARLETVDRTELKKNYDRLAEGLGARVVDSVRFATGSSEISPEKAKTIRAAMAKGASDSFFLVVGYASKTGNFDLNKTLSSARATSVATVADEARLPEQRVRAVFLGQTDRFSETSVYDDQICELWEIVR